MNFVLASALRKFWAKAMHLDVQDLKNFYYRQTLGRAAQRAIRNRLIELWPDTTGQTVVGFGFAVPLLRPFLEKSRRVVALMPGPQGVMPWPAGMPNVSVLTDERLWPLETGRADRIVFLHGLETSDHPSEMLDEARRVLGPGGKAMFIVPNRAGLWSRSDATPMGFGRPYTVGQLENTLRIHGFSPETHYSALYLPPSHRRSWQRLGPALEQMGRKLPFLAGGVLMVEASKRIQKIKGTPSKLKTRRALGVFEGLAKPAPKPASTTIQAHNQTGQGITKL